MSEFLTQQEIFTKVVLHLQQQREPAMHNGTCLYKTKRGLKCAVGCLLEPAAYSPDLEGVGIGTLLDKNEHLRVKLLRAALLNSRVDVDDAETLKLLSQLQGIHDACLVEDWPARLRDTAKDFNLTMPEAASA